MLEIFIFSLLTNSIFFFLGKIYLKKIVNKFENIILNSIIGAILLSILALFTNFFFPLNKIINSILYYLIYVIKIKYINKRTEYSIDRKLIDFIEWFSTYNMVPIGLVLKMAIGGSDNFIKNKDSFLEIKKTNGFHK